MVTQGNNLLDKRKDGEMNLFELDAALYECVDAETGEIIDEEKLNELSMERDEKVENIACWIKELKAQTAAIKQEEDSLAARRKVAENKAQSLSEYLLRYLNGSKFETAKVKISYRKSAALEVSETAKIPEEWYKPQKPKLDVAGLKKAVKDGLEIEGVEIVEKQNIQIK